MRADWGCAIGGRHASVAPLHRGTCVASALVGLQPRAPAELETPNSKGGQETGQRCAPLMFPETCRTLRERSAHLLPMTQFSETQNRLCIACRGLRQNGMERYYP